MPIHPKSVNSIFDERFQAGQCLVPLLRDKIEVAPQFLDGLRIELEEALATGAGAADDFSPLQYPKMFGDRLPGEAGAVRELGDRAWLAAGQGGEEREAGFVAGRGEDGCLTSPGGGLAVRVSARHELGCSSFARSSRRRSCGRIPVGWRRAGFQSPIR